MGSKGSSPQTTQQTQTTTPNPYVAGGGQQAIQGAEFAAGLPFQMPVSPLAPFSPMQNQAFQGVNQAVGMAQPYFGAGAGFLAGSAAPVTGQDVAGYYNPMAQNVFAQMGNIFGQQQRDITGKLTQAAGGVGADRIAVGQSELANQQGLAAGQTAASLYQQALQAAQQQKQMMAGAGYGIAQMGPAAQAAQLQGLQAQLGAGGMQQNLAQQYLNSLYQNRLAQIGYPFQTAQYLAGITGGLAPAMGGTSQGQSQTWAAQPSALAQGLGIGTSLLGLGMAPFTGGASLGLTGLGGMMGGGGMKGVTSGSPLNVVGGAGGMAVPTFFKSGGKVGFEPAHMKGGGTPPPLPPPPKPIYDPKAIGQSGAASASIPPGGISTEQALAEADPYFEWYGGIPAVNQAQIASMTTPMAQRPQAPMQTPIQQQASGWSNPMAMLSQTMPFNFFQSWMSRMNQRGRSGDTMASDPWGTEAAANVGRAQGGAVSPMDVGIGFQEGGDISGFPFTPDVPLPPERPTGTEATPQPEPESREYRGALTLPDFPMPTMQGVGQGITGALSGLSKYPAPESVDLGPLPTRAAAPAAPPMATAPAAAPADVPLPRERPMATAADVPMPTVRPAGASLAPDASLEDKYRFGHQYLASASNPNVAAGVMGNFHVENEGLDPALSHDYGTGVGLAGWRNERKRQLYNFAAQRGINPLTPEAQYDFTINDLKTRFPDLYQRMSQASPANAARMFRTEYERPAGTTQGAPLGLGTAMTAAERFAAGDFSGVGTGEGAENARFVQYRGQGPMGADMSRQVPYPDALDRDWGQRAVRSPWMSLVMAGAKMATTPGPIGSVIGKGIEAGVGTLESQRKDLRSEEDINLKADRLLEMAQMHLGRYQMAEERLGTARDRLKLAQERAEAGSARAPDINSIAKEVYGDPAWSAKALTNPDSVKAEITRRYNELMELYKQQRGSPSSAAPSGPPGSSEANPIPYTEGMKRRKGQYYMVPGVGLARWNQPDET